MRKQEVKQKTIEGFIYKFLERAGAQGISFIISLVLARVLEPDHYGIIALVTVFVSFCDVFVTYGFGNSLIVKKNPDSVDYSTCFYFGLALAVLTYCIVFLCAPFFARFYSNYDERLLITVIRFMAVRIPLAAINTVQHAYVAKRMMFKTFFYSTLIGTVVSGVIAVIMAINGLGVWALVEQYIGNVLLDTFFLWLFVKWRPTLEFSLKRLQLLFDYGWKILVVGLIDTGYNEIRNLVIAKRYSSADLAYYNKGMHFPAFSMKLVEPTINSVMFPSLSNCNGDKCSMLQIVRRFTKLSTYLMFPTMACLAVIAKPLVLILLTEKWLGCVGYLQIGCMAYMLRPIQMINNCIIKASGESSLLLKLDIVKKTIGMLLLIMSMKYGVIYIAYSLLLTNIVSLLINIAPNMKLIGYGYRGQFEDIGTNLILSFVTAGVAYLVGLFIISPLIKVIIQLSVGVVSYILLSYVTHNDSFIYVINQLKALFQTRVTQKKGK